MKSMQKRAPLVRTALLAAIVVGLSGCAATYRGEFEKQAQAKNWTQAEIKHAYYYSLRLKFLKKEEDGTYAVLYSVLPKGEVIKQLEQTLADLEDILDYKNDDWNNYMKTFGLRPYFLRQELVLKASLARLLADANDKKMKTLLGESFSHGVSSSLGYDPALGYDEKVFTVADLPKAFPFKSKVLEEARAAGLLKEVARTMKSDSRTYNQKEPDPDDPTDKNKFVWVAKKISYERIEYKVLVPDEQPQNNNANYVEIWRMVDGKRESSPAIKAFLDGSGSAVLVLDSENESEKIGFGLPNVVERVSESDVYGDAIIARIFPDPRNGKRVEPKVAPISIQIVRAGSPVDPWQACTESGGCRFPASYRREPTKDNYNVRLAMKAEKKKGDTEMTVTIDSVAKEWTDSKGDYSWSYGKVVEYYKPKAQCTGSGLLGAKVLDSDNKKKVRISCKDGTEQDRVVTSFVNTITEDKPYQIAFTIGETRWVVWDTDGDGKFDKRRKASPVLKHDIGIYPFDEAASSRSNPHDGH